MRLGHQYEKKSLTLTVPTQQVLMKGSDWLVRMDKLYEDAVSQILKVLDKVYKRDYLSLTFELGQHL